MRWLAGLLLSIIALALQAAPMGAADARHLLSRTGFGASPDDIARFALLSREQGIAQLLDGTRTVAVTVPPAELREYVAPAKIKELGADERKAFQRDQFRRAVDLRTWWVGEMLATDSPLTERMTLFWHNHFVSSLDKVKSPRLMLAQNELLRRYALGDFGALLHAIAKNSAMLVYLDNASNRRGQPNENFAREVMELFTLGEGHYTEPDIKEAARAFTGWSIEPQTGDFKWRPFAHDNGSKLVLGRRGNLDGDAVLDILLAQPETAEFVVAKLWREFVSPTPDRAEVQRIARRFRESGYGIKVAVGELLRSPAFWAAENRAALTKSPVDLVVGSLRTLHVASDDPLPFAFALRQLGQDLFAPPNVKGWPGGEQWVNSAALLGRMQFVERLLRSDDFMERPREADSASLFFDKAPAMIERRRVSLREEFGKGGNRLGNEGRLRFIHALDAIHFDSRAWLAGTIRTGLDPTAVLLAASPVTPPPADAKGIELLRRLALDPVYQLK